MTTTIKLSTAIPHPIGAVITLGRNAHVGALSIGAAVSLSQNTAPKIGVDFHDLAGDPATPLVLGKQARYAAQIVAVKDAHAAKRDAIRDGREFCRLAINLLRPVLGNEWNTAWQAAGFHLSSLRLPAQPVALLTALRAYFGANPTRENAAAGITATAAEAAADAIDAAILAVGSAKAARVVRKAERDASLKKLRERLSGLRGELDQLLEDDDGRWYEFGFQRPIDGHKPAPVEGLVLLPVGSGTVMATWETSARAQNYRVTWKPTASSDPATEVGLFAETQAVLTSLPAGVPITVAVSARNDSGETTPTEAAVTL
jgi:hypothetical protein